MWKNTVEPGRPHMTIRHMCIACWIPKATNTHLECEILIAFPQQQRLPNATQCHVTRALSVFFFALRPTYWWTAEYEELMNDNYGVKPKYSDMKMSQYNFAHYTSQTEWLEIEPTPPRRQTVDQPPTSQKTHCASITTTNRLILICEVIAGNCTNLMTHTNTVSSAFIHYNKWYT